jgi:hypothetical protein
MVQGYLNRLKGPKTVCFSRSDFDFVIHPLDDACRNATFGMEPVDDKSAVIPYRLGHFLHRFDPRAHSRSN